MRLLALSYIYIYINIVSGRWRRYLDNPLGTRPRLTQPAVVANVQVFDKAQDETLHVRWLCEQNMT